MSDRKTVVAVVVAGGMGQRMQASLPKQFMLLEGRPVVQWSLECFDATPEITGLVLVLPEDWIEEGRTRLRGFCPAKQFKVVSGGALRQDSVRSGVGAIESTDGWVAVHDAARPGITPSLISKALNKAFAHGNAVCALPSHDTLVRVVDNEIVGQLNRDEVYRIQTPQIFKLSVLRQALQNASEKGLVGTDEASLVRELGYRINLAEGSEMSAKITTPEDLAMFAALFKKDFVEQK
ncbi:MAG TPA: 2-C-methyl-D-erythritol 4-phosphate cytidylyltransferase [Candidatus Rifleibacterium sp.]|nr:2-C-methyl-D-erythritol 4-phosphate cytidylyltransferase [Candidatus Rifleibacterium sp.]HPT47336.1 2-C-methyl-D-erythritol 4-phosphate cytidylyltransferase [Candidatus Rifleibacterium sp.]